MLPVDGSHDLGDNISGLSYVASGTASARNDVRRPQRPVAAPAAGQVGRPRGPRPRSGTLHYPAGGPVLPTSRASPSPTPAPPAASTWSPSANGGGPSSASRVILRYTPGAPGSINATTQWNLSRDLTGLGAEPRPGGPRLGPGQRTSSRSASATRPPARPTTLPPTPTTATVSSSSVSSRPGHPRLRAQPGPRVRSQWRRSRAGSRRSWSSTFDPEKNRCGRSATTSATARRHVGRRAGRT